MNQLFIGSSDTNPIHLNLAVIQRHIACFGASGSGKTVACKVLSEELALQGIPMIILMYGIGLPNKRKYLFGLRAALKVFLCRLIHYNLSRLLAWMQKIDSGFFLLPQKML
jgi:hypothetical protein